MSIEWADECNNNDLSWGLNEQSIPPARVVVMRALRRQELAMSLLLERFAVSLLAPELSMPDSDQAEHHSRKPDDWKPLTLDVQRWRYFLVCRTRESLS